MTEATLASTSSSPTTRQLWTRTRGVVLALVLLLAAAVAIAAVRSDARHGLLDPRSADPSGSRAVARLLADQGVSTRLVTTLGEAASGPHVDVGTSSNSREDRAACRSSGGGGPRRSRLSGRPGWTPPEGVGSPRWLNPSPGAVLSGQVRR